MRKGLQQLWYQRYPIPQRNVSFKVFKGFGNGGDRVVQTEEPQDAYQQWPGFRILVQTSSLKIAANSITGHYHICRVFLERMVVVSAPFRPGLWHVQIHLNSLAKRSIRLVIVAELRDEHPFKGEKLCFLRHREVHQVCVVDNFESGLEFG